jgi:flagellar basal body-associated protein FliL
MKNKKTIIIIILVVVLLILFSAWYYLTNMGSSLSKEQKQQVRYKITYVTANKENLNIEYYILSDKDNKIIETRVVENGHSSQELNTLYEGYKSFAPLNYDVEIRDKLFIYSTTINNGKNITNFVDELKNNTAISDVVVKHI